MDGLNSIRGNDDLARIDLFNASKETTAASERSSVGVANNPDPMEPELDSAEINFDLGEGISSVARENAPGQIKRNTMVEKMRRQYVENGASSSLVPGSWYSSS